jgi:hypothetical protein
MRALVSLVLSLFALGCGGPTGPLWEKSASNTTETLSALFGFGPSDVWAAGANGTVLHFDGKAWAKVPSGTSRSLKSIWGATPNDVWFVGESGAALRWNGSSLQPVAGAASVNFGSVRGTAANAVFLCASTGLFFYDGTFHEFTRGGNKVECGSLFALGANVGALVNKANSSQGEVEALDSTGGTVVMVGDVPVGEALMVGVTATDLWLLSQNAKSVSRFGSGAVKELVLPKDMSASAAWVNGPNDVWLGGNQGMLAHFDGTQATLMVAGDYEAPVIHALWGTTGVTWAAGDDGWLLTLAQP